MGQRFERGMAAEEAAPLMPGMNVGKKKQEKKRGVLNLQSGGAENESAG